MSITMSTVLQVYYPALRLCTFFSFQSTSTSRVEDALLKGFLRMQQRRPAAAVLFLGVRVGGQTSYRSSSSVADGSGFSHA